MFRWSLVFVLSAVLVSACIPVLAVDQNSANFKNNSSSFSPTTFDRTSPNFQLNASVDSIVGGAESANFAVMQGVPLREPVPPTVPSTPPGGGSGGGGLPATVPPPAGTILDTVPPPTLEYRRYTFASTQRIGGDRDPVLAYALVNGDRTAVMYPSPWRWAMDFPLTLGKNPVTVQGVRGDGAKSQVIGGEIVRLLVGDASQDQFVDDVDISKFTRATKVYTPFADFNEDEKVDDLDLSLIASHWLMSFPL